MPMSIWVAELRVSDATAAKISSKHGLDVDDIRAAIVGVPGLTFAWHDHPVRGLRAIVELEVGTHPVLAVLYPVDDALGDTWNLGSAYRV